MLNLQVVCVLSALGLRCSAASTVHHVGRRLLCITHDVKQHSDYITIGAARLCDIREFGSMQ
jgi:hypothetical protein